jgi:hypothetical protein
MKRSQLLLYTNLFTLLYLGFGYYLFIALGMGSQQGDPGWGVVIFAVLSIFLIPHLILFSVGLILGWVAFAKNSPGFALASAIVYTLGTLTLFFYFYFGLISTVLAYVAYALMLKAKKKAQLNVVDPLP